MTTDPIQGGGHRRRATPGEGRIQSLLSRIRRVPAPHAPSVLLLAGFVAVGGALLAGSAIVVVHLAGSAAMGPTFPDSPPASRRSPASSPAAAAARPPRSVGGRERGARGG